jgi:hypothetical protein
MLAQLLEKHGLGAKVASYNAASRDAIASLDVTGTAMICISYLDIRGSPSHLRYLLQRLRRRMPGIPILVGLWPADDEVLQDKRLQTTVGADYYVTSLREAVNVCVTEAQKEQRPAAPAQSVERDAVTARSIAADTRPAGA